jgi:SAM-dependent methyltransferase
VITDATSSGISPACMPRDFTHDARVKKLAVLLVFACNRDCPPPTGPVQDRAVVAQAEKPIIASATDTRNAFEKIYRDADWGTNASGIGNSGTGSTMQATELYRRYLEMFMKEHGIKSVVDAGCGDWEFSQKIDWSGIDYRGYDIVAAVVEADKKRFGKEHVQFFVGNMIEDDLPAADLLISKHVLQHLPNADVKKFLDKQLKKYKHVLLTNGVNKVYLSGLNKDIKPGDYRELDITRPPFDVPASKELTYWANDFMHQVVHVDNTKGR